MIQPSDVDTSKPSLLSKWINLQSCLMGCFGYVAGLATLIILGLVLFESIEDKKDKFLARETNKCRRCDLSGENLALRNFNYANFYKANLENAVLGGTKLENTRFTKANLKQAVLRQADLENAVFDGANLTEADFSCGGGSCTYLANTSFKNANLYNANFSYVGTTEWEIETKGLPNVDFTDANLTKATFEGANIKGAKLDKAILCKTTMPDGKISNRDC